MKKNKKVLVICQHYWPETFRVTDLCEGFVENGYDVDVLCGIPNYPTGKFFKGYGIFKNRRQKYKGVNIFRVLEIPRGNNSNLRISLNYLSFSFFALFHLFKLRKNGYDRVLVYELSPVFMIFPGIVMSRLIKKPLYVYICDFWPYSLFSIIKVKNKFIVKQITKMSFWHYKQANGLMGVFKGIQKRLVNEVKIAPEKTLYIPQAAEKFYEKEEKNKSLEKKYKNRFKIVFAGNINPAQSFETIISAAEKLKNQNVTNIIFIIIGGGMSKNWLIDQVRKKQLTELFSFEGFKPVEEIPQYQTLADVLICALSKSQLFEYGIPAKIQSYMASGKPIVAAMNGSANTLINTSGSGIAVKSGDSQGLANAILTLYKMTPLQRKKIGEMARKYHFAHFERNYNLNRVIEFVFNNKRIEDIEPDY